MRAVKITVIGQRPNRCGAALVAYVLGVDHDAADVLIGKRGLTHSTQIHNGLRRGSSDRIRLGARRRSLGAAGAWLVSVRLSDSPRHRFHWVLLILGLTTEAVWPTENPGTDFAWPTDARITAAWPIVGWPA